ncbi:hypothetical protein RIF29_26721 [Crotalaria pallida]|uniref:Reverse transcriptase zinc-binding domain-containing protein n=1 Tax=Crotalaria pallida TaxID=3830 RepID=A0AAN9ENZ2_CROPI
MPKDDNALVFIDASLRQGIGAGVSFLAIEAGGNFMAVGASLLHERSGAKIAEALGLIWASETIQKFGISHAHIWINFPTVKDVCENGRWNLNSLYSWIPNEVKQLILSVPVPISPSCSDVIRWSESIDGIYTARTAYLWLGQHVNEWDTSNNNSWIWNSNIPAKTQRLIWLATKNVVPTNSLRYSRGLSTTMHCTRCSHVNETIFHCFRDCPHAKEVWMRIGMLDKSSFLSNNLVKWLQHQITSEYFHLFSAGL